MKNRYLMMFVTGTALAVLLWAIVNVLSAKNAPEENPLAVKPRSTASMQEDILIAPASIDGGLWRDQMVVLQGTGEAGGTITLQADLSSMLKKITPLETNEDQDNAEKDEQALRLKLRLDGPQTDPALNATPKLTPAPNQTIEQGGAIKPLIHVYGKTIVQENGHWDLTIPQSKFPTQGIKNQVAIASVMMTTLDGRLVRSDQSLIIAFQPMAGGSAPKTKPLVSNKASNKNTVLKKVGPRHSALVVLTAPGANSRVLVSPYDHLPNVDGFTLEAIDYDNSGGVIFSGTSPKNGKVRVYANDNLVGESHVDRTGRWSLIFGNILPLGRYNLTLERVAQQPDDQSKDNLSRIVLPFSRLNPAETTQNLHAAVIDYTEERIEIVRKLYGGGHQYTVIYSDQAILNP